MTEMKRRLAAVSLLLLGGLAASPAHAQSSKASPPLARFAPTAALTDNSNRIANTAWVRTYLNDPNGNNVRSNWPDNLFIGAGAGVNNLLPSAGPPGVSHFADRNTFVGVAAGQQNTSGFAQTFLGWNAGHATTTGDSNIYVGYNAGAWGTTANANVAIGVDAISNNVTGQNITAVGHHAASAVLNADNGVYIGAEVNNGPGSGGAAGSTMVGYRSGYNTSAGGFGSSFFGNLAGYANTAGSHNSYFGKEAGTAGSTASNGAFFGYRAGYSNVTGSGSVFLGNQAGYWETASNILMIDNAARANQSDARAKALIWGVFDAVVANQSLTVNGRMVVNANATPGLAGPRPPALLSLYGEDASNALAGMFSFGAGAAPAILQRAARGTAASPAASQSGDSLGAYVAGGYAASDYDAASNSGIGIFAGEDHTLTANGTYISLLTVPNGTTTRVEAMRINGSGGVGVGTTADPGNGTMILKKQTFASLTACSSTIEGTLAAITDSSTARWGETITGSSTNHVLGYCDGTNWTVR